MTQPKRLTKEELEVIKETSIRYRGLRGPDVIDLLSHIAALEEENEIIKKANQEMFFDIIHEGKLTESDLDSLLKLKISARFA